MLQTFRNYDNIKTNKLFPYIKIKNLIIETLFKPSEFYNSQINNINQYQYENK